MDAEAYQGPSPTLNAAPIVTIQRYLRTPNLAWDFLTLAEPEPWDAYFAVADLPRATGADFMVAGRRFGLFCHDFRRVPVDAWLELVTERALAQDFTLPPVRSPDVLVLSQPEFEEAVRQALRDLHRPDLLSRNPLLRTRLVRDRAGGQPSAAVLEAVVREAIETLQAHPREDKLFRADLCTSSPDPGGGRRFPRPSVQHLQATPHPGHDACRVLAVGAGGVRQR